MNLLKPLSLLALIAATSVSATNAVERLSYLPRTLELNSSSTGSMYLGDWKNDMAAKIMPTYFDYIASNQFKIGKQFSKYVTYVTGITPI